MNKRIIKYFIFLFFSLCMTSSLSIAEDGYDLWLRYKLIPDTQILSAYSENISSIKSLGDSETIKIALNEMSNGLNGLLGENIKVSENIKDNMILIGKIDQIKDIIPNIELNTDSLGPEGYIIHNHILDGKNITLISANTDVGVLYGVFHYLKLIQTHKKITNLKIIEVPQIEHRVLNHWDNLDRTSERGYSGFSIWDWHRLPELIKKRYIDYARANASIGINGTVLTNVNANSLVLSNYYLMKVKALADLFRPYGIKVFLTARFSAPIELGGLTSADPLNKDVIEWWQNKIDEIYKLIPDFGGFLVKANSEGQPGPQNYGRTHADGANLLAGALAKHDGIVMWRAFVYSHENDEDRAKQAYTEFTNLRGEFSDNVAIQVKNGPIDFQPREPFHPLFGAMPETPLFMEFQITQEYLGQATQLVYLAPMWKEVLNADTYSKGEGSTVSKVINGTLHNYSMTGIAGVSNIGNDRNWTGHDFGQSNWYAFGRLAWDAELSSELIADEWIKMTFSNEKKVVNVIKSIMLNSHEAAVNYMTPLGLHHIMGWDHHYGPGPWIKNKGRADWTSVYYHRADKIGIGFNRGKSGSNAVSQYFPEVERIFSELDLIPEKYLLWFHHVDWDQELRSGNKLWDELCYKYSEGVDSVKSFRKQWTKLKNSIDGERFVRINQLLKIHENEARWWRDACLLYFQTFSNKPLPKGLEKPSETLEYYMNLEFPYAPGIRPKW